MSFPVSELLAALQEHKRLASLPYDQLPIEAKERLMAVKLRQLKLKLLERQVAELEKLLSQPTTNQEPSPP